MEHRPSTFLHFSTAVSAQGWLVPWEEQSRCCLPPPSRQAVFPRIPVELVVIDTHAALWKIQHVVDSRENIYFCKAYIQIGKRSTVKSPSAVS